MLTTRHGVPPDGTSESAILPRRILLVEDDGVIQESISCVLTDEGYEVWTSGDGMDALDRLRHRQVDLIILDLMLPIMNGWQFRTVQRADPTIADIPVIAISADGSPQASAVHAEHYLRKPFRAVELLHAVERAFLERERDRLSERLRVAERIALLGTVAAGVGHEINNPLTYVIGNLDVLESELVSLAEESDPRRREQLVRSGRALIGDVRTGAERIRAVVDSLRRVSRPRSGPRQTVDVRRVVETSIAIAANEIRHRARLETRIGCVPAVMGDEARLGQVFVNLLINAAQAIPPGSVASNEIRVGVSEDEPWVLIEVEDTGAGMDAEVQSRLFEPFFTTKDAASGTGLGLAISRNIVLEHGGKMEFESSVGGGTIFRVRLPRVSPAPTAETQPADRLDQTVATAERTLRVLVIDDDPLVAAAIERMLVRDHDVTSVADARMALASLDEAPAFDAILCDVMMPNMTGMEFHSEVVRLHGAYAPRIIFMTGGAFAPEARDFLDRVPNRCLDKPFTIETVTTAITEIASANESTAAPGSRFTRH
jgi:signal transduction histidine kinase